MRIFLQKLKSKKGVLFIFTLIFKVMADNVLSVKFE